MKNLILLFVLAMFSLGGFAGDSKKSCREKLVRVLRAVEAVNVDESYAKGLEIDEPQRKGDMESIVNPSLKLDRYEIMSNFMGGTGIHEMGVTKDEFCRVEYIREIYSE